MVDYPYAGILVADAVTFRRATSAAVTVYDVNDTAEASPLVLKDLSGLPLPNPLTSSADGFVQPFVTTSEGVKLKGGGLTVVEYSHKGMRDAAAAAATAAQDAANAAIDAAGEAVSAATVNPQGNLILTQANGELRNAGNVMGPAGPKGDKGADGANVLPTDTAIKNAITTPGTETAAALSATYASAFPDSQGITYNPDDTVATVTENGVTTSYNYNPDGTVATDSRTVAGVTTTRTYTYTDGNLTGIEAA